MNRIQKSTKEAKKSPKSRQYTISETKATCTAVDKQLKIIGKSI